MKLLATKITHRFQVFPQDLNAVRTLFGGKLMAEMDLAASMLCRKLLRSSDAEGAVTKSFSKIEFDAPAHVDDLVEIEADLKMLGKSSLRIRLTATKENADGERIKIASSSCVFVALKNKKPHPHGLRWDQFENNTYFS